MVRKDGKILVTYDNARKLVETHLKGLELKKIIKRRRFRLRKAKRAEEALVEIHTCLRNSVKAFNFEEEDYKSLKEAFPKAKIKNHDSYESLKKSGSQARILLTWNLSRKITNYFPNLKAVITPAAGNDWVESDPTGKASVFYGTFHGEIMRESILGAVFFS